MAKEEGIFIVSEDENIKSEIIVVDEDEIISNATGMFPMGLGPGMGMGPGMGPGKGMGPMGQKQEDDDWRTSKSPKCFLKFFLNELSRLPQISSILGNRSALEKAHGQYRKLDSYISQALQSDYDDEIDTKKVDELRKRVEQIKDQIEDALEGLSYLSKQKKKMRRRRAEDEHDGELTKEAGTASFQMVITPFQRAISGSLINGVVSGGRNMEELWADAKKKYNMNDREELEILQVIADMGYPEFKDRLRLGENNDPTRDEGFGEWSSQYYA